MHSSILIHFIYLFHGVSPSRSRFGLHGDKRGKQCSGLRAQHSLNIVNGHSPHEGSAVFRNFIFDIGISQSEITIFR